MIRSTFDGFDKTYRGEELAQLMRKLKRQERQLQQTGEVVLSNDQATDSMLTRIGGWLKSQLGLGDVSHQDWGESSEVHQEIEQKYALLIPLAVEDLFLKHRKFIPGPNLGTQVLQQPNLVRILHSEPLSEAALNAITRQVYKMFVSHFNEPPKKMQIYIRENQLLAQQDFHTRTVSIHIGLDYEEIDLRQPNIDNSYRTNRGQRVAVEAIRTQRSGSER